jgi:DTW domain-containing protein YfiP
MNSIKLPKAKVIRCPKCGLPIEKCLCEYDKKESEATK